MRRPPARRAEHPAPGAGVEDVACVDRQQRGHAAKQHGEQVERYGAEDRRIATDEAHAGKHAGERRRFLLSCRPVELDRRDEHGGKKRECSHDGVGRRRREGVGNAAERRAADHRDLKSSGVKRSALLQRSFGHHGRE